jgi:hypothetical protein
VAIAVLGGLLVLQRGSGAAVITLLGALALGALQQIYRLGQFEQLESQPGCGDRAAGATPAPTAGHC